MSLEKNFILNFGKLQELFAKLSSEGLLDQSDINIYNKAQESIISYHSWVKTQLSPDNDTSIELPWNEPEFKEAWNGWKAYRKQQHKFTFKPIGESAALADLVQISGNNMQTAIDIINHCIKKTWMGLFPINHKVRKGEKKIEIDNLNEINHG